MPQPHWPSGAQLRGVDRGDSSAQPWQTMRTEGPANVWREPMTPLLFLERSAEVWADRVAAVDAGTRITYSQMGCDAMRAAHGLAALGVRRGDRVAYLMPNIYPMLLGHFAVPLAGAILVAINTRLSPGEVAYILNHSGARVLVVDDSLADTAVPALRDAPGVEHVVWTGDTDRAAGRVGAGYLRHVDLLADEQPMSLTWRIDDEDSVISINYTSGTTGRPKGVMYTHRGAYLNALGELLHSGFTSDSVYLWTLPMFHCNGWCTTWAVTAIGATHICLAQVRPDEIWAKIDSEQITHLNGAPTVVTSIINAPSAHPLTRPLYITTAGAPPSPTTIAAAEALGFHLTHVYGLTETYGPYSVCEAQHGWSDLPGTERARLMARQGVGMIQADRLRVVDLDMRDVPRDGATMGEIVMRGNNVMLGYYNDPEGTKAAFRGGWFHSGDLGVMHPDGYIELRDRAKDIVISGGENISTVEVEQAIMAHPAVLEVAVVGVPDDKWGERPKAFVVLKAGATASEREILEHTRGAIAHFKVPREIALLAELPKTSTGKVQKFALREAEWVGHESRIKG
jgi:fatty-acyl-CoA synthase